MKLEEYNSDSYSELSHEYNESVDDFSDDDSINSKKSGKSK